MTPYNRQWYAKRPFYFMWIGIKRRCYDTRCHAFQQYGARGIELHTHWHSYQRFEADILNSLGPRPSAGHTLDRINNDGHYEPGNVRWATRTEQARNSRKNVILTVGGVSQSIAAWAEQTGLSHGILSYRLRNGWSHTAAVCTPLGVSSRGENNHSAKLTEQIVLNARKHHAMGASISQLAREANVHKKTMREAIYGIKWRHLGSL